MSLKDAVGYSVTGATEPALAAYERAADELRCLQGDPIASVDEALAHAPTMVMAHVLKAWLHLLGTEPGGFAVARECLAAADALPADARERGHLEAIRLLLAGEWRAAGRVLEDVEAAWPLDALALQAGHQIDFFCGESRMLRDRVARVLPHWNAALPGYHAVLGMYAFGLEECGDYAAAERYGRESVERQRLDSWGWHAVAHVLEMQDRGGEGIVWLRQDTPAWSERGFLAVHNWWHLALFHLEGDEIDEVLRLFDGPIHGSRSSLMLDMVDAAALLWRLRLRGIEPGARWRSVADGWAPHVGASNYAFNDCHAMLAFVGADRPKAQAAVLEALQAAAAGAPGDVALFAREVGLAVANAVHAFGRGDYAEAVKLLRPIRSQAHRFGGSHAQRDLVDLTLLEAAWRAGMRPLALALAHERLARRPRSAWARMLVQRSEEGSVA